MRLSLTSLSLLLLAACTAHAAGTEAMSFEVEGAWRTAFDLPEGYKEDELWSVRTIPYSELAGGVKLSRDHVKQGQFAGRWADHPRYPTIHTRQVPTDWSGFRSLSLWAYSEVATGEQITLAVLSDTPATAWKDFYLYTFSVDWTGWRNLQLSLKDFTPYEQPAGWQQVSGLYFFTKIFNRQPNPYTVLYLDDLQLSADEVKSTPPPPPAPVPLPGLSITGDAPAFDRTILNHTYPEVRDKPTTPFQYESYFLAERALYGYYPRFNPGTVSFDPQGRAFVQYSEGLIQTVGPDGKWQVQDLLHEVIEPYVREKMGYNSLELSDGGSGNETTIRFDNDGGVYLLCVVSEKMNDWKTRKALLLYSPDRMKTWQVYLLPEYEVRFEKFVGNNPDCLRRPPVILLSHYLSPTKIYLTVPEKQPDGTLAIPEPLLICEDAIALVPHSGESNQAVTLGDSVFIVYGRLTVLPGHKQEDGAPAYAIRYDLKTKMLSQPVLIGFGGKNSEDGHNWPGLAADSKGLLHVVINGHHDPFVYTHSLKPADISEWSTPEKVAVATSYGGLVCDRNDILYTVTRNSDPGYYFRLSLHRKLPGQPWEQPQHLAIPYKAYYKVWYHKLSIDPVRGRLFLAYWSQTASLCLFRDEYEAAIYMWPDREKRFLTGNPVLPLGSYKHEPRKYQFYTAPPSELTVILSEDQGKTWRLATTEDFR